MESEDLKKKVGQNIKRLRIAAGIKSQAELASLCGWKSQSRVGNYEAGTRAVSAIDAGVLAKVLNATPAEILYGESRDHSIANVSQVEGKMSYRNSFPVISFVQAGVWTEALEEPKVSEYYETTERTSGNCFWLRVKGDSMTAPFGLSFPEGTMILVDTDRDYQSGSYVVAKLIDVNEATFKKLVIDAGTKLLKPLNPTYPTLPINGNCRIVGVVVDAKLKLF